MKHSPTFEAQMLRFRIQGHPSGLLSFHPGIAKCGDITDGVSLWPGQEGPWVVSFTDLEEMYLAAKTLRNAPT